MAIYEILDSGGVVVRRVVADQAFVERKWPGMWRLEQEPVVESAPRPRLALVSASTDDVDGIVGDGEITCSTGSAVSVVAELRAHDDSVIPVTSTFRMPIVARDGRERVIFVHMTDGVASINATMNESGVWRVSEDTINMALPEDQRMSFDGICIYVVQ